MARAVAEGPESIAPRPSDSAFRWERALAESDPDERAAAIRILRLRRGRCVADLDQVDEGLRDLERRYQGIGDD